MPIHKSRSRLRKSVKARQKRTRKQRGSGEVTSYSPETIRATVFDDLKGLQTYLNRKDNKQRDGVKPQQFVLDERHNDKNALNMAFLEPTQKAYFTFYGLQRRKHACRRFFAGVNWHIVYELVNYGFDPHYKSPDMKETPFKTMERCFNENPWSPLSLKHSEPNLFATFKIIMEQYIKGSVGLYERVTDEKKDEKINKLLQAFFPEQSRSTSSSPIETPPSSPRA